MVAQPVVSAQASASISSVSGNSFILNLAGSRSEGGNNAPVLYFIAPVEELANHKTGSNIWANISYGDGEVDTVSGNNGFDYDSIQLNIGSDLYQNGRSLLGVFGSVQRVDSEVANIANVNSEQDNFQLGLYGKTAASEHLDLTLAGSLIYARVDATRGTASGDTHGFGYALGAELSKKTPWRAYQGVEFSPYLSLQTATLGLRDYSETGAGAQRVINDSNSQFFSTVGMRVKKDYTAFGKKATPQGAVSYVREWLDEPASSVSFPLGGGGSTVATAPDVNDNYLRLDGSYAAELRDNLHASLSYTGLHNNDVTDNLFGISARYTW